MKRPSGVEAAVVVGLALACGACSDRAGTNESGDADSNGANSSASGNGDGSGGSDTSNDSSNDSSSNNGSRGDTSGTGGSSGGDSSAETSSNTGGVEVENPLTDPEDGPPAGNPDATCSIPAEAGLEDSSNPDHVVGDGVPESCTGDAFIDAVAQGGVIRFDCGSEPHTITL
ncbi:MAG TPA: hypothetical protein VI197_32800, partial [Polyangiaceae bacterium]